MTLEAQNTTEFDEKAVQAMDLLFHHYWILRAEQPEWYQLIREREKVLRRYITEKFGLRLLIHQHFIKLEKIPAEPERWMGIKTFQEKMDYAIFCCALSFLEGKSVDEQFLLSDLCQDIQVYYPGDFDLDWTMFTHRKSLIRAVKALMDFRLIRTIDGDIGHFDHNEEHEVLYEATIYSRYFMRTYPEDFNTYTHWSDLLKEDRLQNQEDERRKRVYRRLFFSPGLHRINSNDPDFTYIRSFRNRLVEDIEKHSDYVLHVYKNTAFLSASESRTYQVTFPSTRATSDLLLQLSHYLHTNLDRFPPNENGEMVLTEGDFDQILDTLRGQFEAGWAKFFRDKTTPAIRADLVNEMKDWMLGDVDENSLIKLKPLLGVMAGVFPDDFEGDVTNDEQ